MLRKASLAVLLLALIVAGCGGQTQPAPEPEPDTEPSSPDVAEVSLYFSDKDAMNLVCEVREVEVSETEDMPLVALEELAKGTTNPDLGRVIPDETQVLSVDIRDGVAYADFSEELQKNHWGGSAGESLTVYAIVNTLTEFEGIEKVVILIEGEEIETLAGHLNLSEPLSRDEDIIKK